MKRIFIPIFVAVLFFGAFGFVNFAKATCDKPKGTISVSPSTYEINKDFTIRLVGSDDNDIKYLRICYHTGGDSQGVEKCKEAHFLSPFGLGLDKTGKLNWTLHKEEPGTYIFYGKITDSDKEGGFDACTVDHIDEPSDPESVTVKVIISSPESICDYESYTDRAGETKSADGWCTGGAACSGGNCGDDTYDFCVGNTWYHFGCKCTLLNCSCDSSKAATPKNCPGGCIKWACDDEGCSGGACKGKEDMPQIGTISPPYTLAEHPQSFKIIGENFESSNKVIFQLGAVQKSISESQVTRDESRKLLTFSIDANFFKAADVSKQWEVFVESNGVKSNSASFEVKPSSDPTGLPLCEGNCKQPATEKCRCGDALDAPAANLGQYCCWVLSKVVGTKDECPAACASALSCSWIKRGCGNPCKPEERLYECGPPSCTGECTLPAGTPPATQCKEDSECTGKGKPPDGGDGWPYLPGITVELENPLTATTVTDLIDRIINFIWFLAIVFAPIMFLIGGFTFLTSGGDPQKVSKGKNIMIYAAVGLAIVLVAKGIIALLKDILGVKPEEAEPTSYFQNFGFFAIIGLESIKKFFKGRK